VDVGASADPRTTTLEFAGSDFLTAIAKCILALGRWSPKP
jgi:hypothetical protein